MDVLDTFFFFFFFLFVQNAIFFFERDGDFWPESKKFRSFNIMYFICKNKSEICQTHYVIIIGTPLLPEACLFHSDSDRIYSFGGYFGVALDTISYYDINSTSWISLSLVSLLIPRYEKIFNRMKILCARRTRHFEQQKTHASRIENKKKITYNKNKNKKKKQKKKNQKCSNR